MIENIQHTNPISNFILHYNGAAQLEKVGNRGISHLMEHLICKGYEHLEQKMNRYGIYTNAETSGTDILFYMNGLEPYINKFKQDYVDGILSFNITEKQLENEKKIVLQEYEDTFNNQTTCHILNFYRRYLNDFNAIGCEEDLKSINLNNCKDFFSEQFVNPTKLFNVYENDKYDKFLDFNKWRDYDSPKFDYYSDNPIVKRNFNDNVSLIYHSDVITDNFAEMDIISMVLGSGLISPLYKIVREKYGLVYYIQSSFDQLTNNSGMFMISTMTNKSNVNKIKNILTKMFEHPEKILTPNRFNNIKQSTKINFQKSNIIKGMDFIYRKMHNDKWNLEENIDNISYSDLLEVFNKYLKNMKFNIDTEYR